jgi:RNA polymerase sigma-70 factor (ECF subfamily)
MAAVPSDVPRPVEKYRAYLLLLARNQVRGELQGKLDASDLVQETLLKAHKKLDQFNGQSDRELAAWLRQILANTLIDAVRKLRPELSLGEPLERALEESSARLEAWLVADEESPEERAIRQDELLELADALVQLPEDQRTALELKHLQGWSVEAIAKSMGRTKYAVGGLLRRGVEKLREILQGDS